MGKALYESSAIAKGLFDKAPGILGFDIARIMFEGTEDELKQTSVTQPAIFIHSVAVAMAGGYAADMTAGHSLGEYSAHVAAGTLEFGDAVRLVHHRGQYMQAAVPVGEGAMAAILGLDQLGTVAAGKSADFLVLDANPLDSIANTRRISKVYLRGAELDRAALKSRWAGVTHRSR